MKKTVLANVIFVCAATFIILTIVLVSGSGQEQTSGITVTQQDVQNTPGTPSTSGGTSGTGGATSSQNPPTVKSYTLSEVATHKTSSSCWTVVRNDVYDVTSWISQHPGGSGAIVSMCGVDATAAFEGQHGGQRRPENELTSFKIGLLKTS